MSDWQIKFISIRQRLRSKPVIVCGAVLLIMGIVISLAIMGHTASQKKPRKTKPVNTVKLTPKAPATNNTKGASISNNLPAWTKLPLYVDPSNQATAYYQNNPNAQGAGLIKRQGERPVATWFGDWDPDPQAAANKYVSAAAQAKAVPMLALYNIPQRDCGNYSAGGAASNTAYTKWVQAMAAGIGGRAAIVILEPDALAGLDCLSPADQQNRYTALSQAVAILKTNPNTAVYLDAGNAGWHPASTVAPRLQAADVAQADGFSLNVSNFITTDLNQNYGDQLSKLVGNKHYVIDTSRNGGGGLRGDDWCNPAGAALGSDPTTTTGRPLNDALLWIKRPWESDGACNGAPDAGMVNWPYAIKLAQKAGWQ